MTDSEAWFCRQCGEFRVVDGEVLGFDWSDYQGHLGMHDDLAGRIARDMVVSVDD